MSSYTTITVSESIYQDIIIYLEMAAEHSNDYDDIESIVHVIALLEEEYLEDSGRKNKELQDFLRYQELHDKNKEPHPELFSKIRQILYDKNVKLPDPNGIFFLTCELTDLIGGQQNDGIQEE